MADLPATSDNNRATTAEESELPPEEQFWERYSPHHEFPLSTVSAVAVCGLVVGLLMLNALRLSMARQDEVSRPPRMDAVEIEGGGGSDGPGGPGQGAGGPDTPRKELVTKPSATTTVASNTNIQKPSLDTAIKPQQLQVPSTAETKQDVGSENIFNEIEKDARDEVERALAQASSVTPANPPVKGSQATGSSGAPGDPGKGGGRGGGTGTGIGTKVGPGSGKSPFGQVLTKSRKREMRWNIDFSGSGKQHLDKLRALNITLALPANQPGMFELIDLTRNPPATRVSNLSDFGDKVKWFNSSPTSLQQLAEALGRRMAPRYVAIFLPEAMEEEMAQLERNYRNLEEHQIRLTRFVIENRPDGSYGPKVVEQQTY